MGGLRLKYSPVAMAFHWAIAVLIISNFVIAWIMNGHALVWSWGEMHGPAKTSLVQYHKSIGITVLVLSVLRLVWRLITPRRPSRRTWRPGRRRWPTRCTGCSTSS